MENPPVIKVNQRYHTLDALRGIACLSVVFGHCLNASTSTNWIYEQTGDTRTIHDVWFYLAYSPLHFFWAGPNAVKVFFILSGFVLSIPYYKKDITGQAYFKFFIKRILRLYLPCLAIILICFGVKYTYYNPEATVGYGYFIKGFLSQNFYGMELLKVFLLRGPECNLNPVLWTLSPEIKLSLILPFFVYILHRQNIIWSFLSVFLMVLINSGLRKFGCYSFLPEVTVLYYMTFFLIGAVICKYSAPIIGWVNSINAIYFFCLVVISLYLYSFSYSMWWLPIPSKLRGLALKYDDYVVAVAGVLFLIFALSKRFERLLSFKFFKFIGDISFSLYLVHHIVILTSVYLLSAFFNQYQVVIIGLICCFPVAYLFYKLVEIPSLKLANNVADKLSGLILIKDDIKPELFDSSKTQ